MLVQSGAGITGILLGNRKNSHRKSFWVNNTIVGMQSGCAGMRKNAGAPPGDKLGMADVVNALMLVCATLASLAFGVLAAYGICRSAFWVFRIHAGQVAAQRAKPQIAPVSHS